MERVPVAKPAIAHRRLSQTKCIDRRDQGCCPLDLYQDNAANRVGSAPPCVVSKNLLKHRPFRHDGGSSLEAIALAYHRVNHIDLHDWIATQVGDGLRG